eukprot:TRINITY_DN11505_c0_g1_i1.p2 TRINITY_DN11505_c0_g1~~TRINITY_DN11505_c0_g1_i1.p2  ORF type:complete len:102 (+),score=16.93 TRINITY_DN11505_c0_g1_i1:62-367(+)
MSVYGRVHEHGLPGASVTADTAEDDGDWETEKDYVNDISEKEQRWGSKILMKPPDAAAVRLDEVRAKAKSQHEEHREKEYKEKRTLYGKDKDITLDGTKKT